MFLNTVWLTLTTMAITIAGVSVSAFYSAHALVSRISVRFADASKHLSRAPSETSLSRLRRLWGFTSVVDFLIDPRCAKDIVLGSDWANVCTANGFSSLVNTLPVYTAGRPSFSLCLEIYDLTDISL